MEKPKKRRVGRPSVYDAEYHCDMAFKIGLLGCTDERMAEIFAIDISTFHKWKLDHPEFSDALKKSKEEADATVIHSLYKRATGYTATKVVTASNCGVITDVKEVDEYVGPDTTAAIFWLKNRQPKNWRDKQDIEHSGHIGREMSDEELDAAIAERTKGAI